MSLTPQEKADEVALDLFIQQKLQSENDWRRRLAYELGKSWKDGFDAGKIEGLRIQHEQHAKIWQEGFSAASEKAKGIALDEPHTAWGAKRDGEDIIEDIARRIGEMEPDK